MRKEERYDGSDSPPLLKKALLHTFWKEYIRIGLMMCIHYVVLLILYPLIISWIVAYFNVDSGTKRVTQSEALTYAGYLVVCMVFSIAISHHANLMLQQMGMRVRIACCSLVYKKVRIRISIVEQLFESITR